MIKIKYNPTDPRYIFLVGVTPHEAIILTKHFNKIPSYQFLPTYTGIPTPEVYLNRFDAPEGRIYICSSGLWKEVWDCCKANNISIEPVKRDLYAFNPVSNKEFVEVMSHWKDLNISPRDYQVSSARMIVNYKMSLSELATRSGKTLITTMVLRYLMEKRGIKKVLMIVPSIQLVKQGAKDFADYMHFFKTGQVWAGSDVVGDENCIIGTFNSLVLRLDPRSSHYNPHYFDDIDCVIVDEVHRAKAKSIKEILRADFMKNVKVRFGLTGTLPKKNTIEWLNVQAMLGPVCQRIEPKELVDGGFLAKPMIYQYRIIYSETDIIECAIRCAEYLCSNYVKDDKGNHVLLPKDQREFTMIYKKTLPIVLRDADKTDRVKYLSLLEELCKGNGAGLLNLEQMLVHRGQRRIALINKIIKHSNGNGIIFAQHVEYIKYLVGEIKKAFPDKNIYVITGSKSLKKRLQIIDEMEKNDNCILVASYATCSTGITFKNIQYGIFAQSFKSEIINRQSIGRLMLKGANKDSFPLYDIVDCFPTKRLYLQGTAKIKSYKEDGWPYKIIEI